MCARKDKKATINDVARAANVSIASVSRFMNGQDVWPKSKERIEAAVKALNYTENYFAKNLRQKTIKTICLLTTDFRDSFYMNILAEISLLCEKHDIELIVLHYDNSAAQLNDRFIYLKSMSVDGIILFIDALDEERIEAINSINREIPLVLMDTMSPDLNVSMVLLDNFGSAAKATQYLIDNGHQRIAVITGSERFLSSQERLDGVLHTLDNHGILCPSPYVKRVEIFAQSHGYAATQELMSNENPPTAIFAQSYQLTFGVTLALQDLGLKMPDDVSVIGFDYHNLMNSISAGVTCVDQPLAELSSSAFNILWEKITKKENPQHPDIHRIQANLIINNSVKNIITIIE